jgi:superfamily II DNA or RNA helicase
MVKSIEQPDLNKIKRNKTGEYMLNGKKRRIYTQSIVGNVIDRWKKYNPDARPTSLYAPGVAESRWLTEKFNEVGIPWAHVDATDCVMDGKQTKLSRERWDELFERWKDGNIKGLSSRFKLREGIDLPELYYCILATPIGSLCSYLQTVGRVLRYSEATPDAVIVQDHGGNYWRHGSPNHDRPWDEWWNLSEHAVSSQFQDTVQQRLRPEPIRCPQCEMERAGGSKCPGCGFEHRKSSRVVIQESGHMREMEGELIKPRVTRQFNDTQDKWTRMYWGFRKNTDRTFNQMEAWFFHEHHYYPPRALNYMPTNPSDWYRKVSDVSKDQLTWPEPAHA